MDAAPPKPRAPEPAGGHAGRVPLLLFLIALLVYNLNLQRIAAIDSVGASLLPFSLLLDGSIALDRFQPWFTEHAPQHAAAFLVRHGHAWSTYPIGLPVLATPLYVPAALAARLGAWDTRRIITVAAIHEKLTASLLAALSVALLYCLVRRLTEQTTAVLVACLYAFGTETWTISSQALWTHGGTTLAVTGSFYYLLRASESPPGRGYWILAGLFGGLAYAIRPTNALFLLAAGASLAWGRRFKGLCLFSLFPLLAVTLTSAYNVRVFGHVLGRYTVPQGADFWAGLTGILFSPGRGLFVYTPVFLFSLAGAFAWLRERGLRHSPVYTAAVLFTFLEVLVVSWWPEWWGGHCFGPRLLTDVAPCLALLTIPAMPQVRRAVALRAAFAASLVASVSIQAIGAFCYPNSRWDETPVAVGQDIARLWDWRDSPVARSLAAGPRIGPDPKFYEEIRRALGLGTGRRALKCQRFLTNGKKVPLRSLLLAMEAECRLRRWASCSPHGPRPATSGLPRRTT